MGVERGHIQLLLSPTPQSLNHATSATYIPATRANIVNALIGLSTDNSIAKDDNILIYFSGHGASYECSDYYASSPASAGAIEALCPADRNLAARNGIPDISDRELSTILSEICRTKGHHITVILDCCHASGATRDVGGSTVMLRMAGSSYKPCVAIAAMLTAADNKLGQFTTADGSRRYGLVIEGNWQAESKDTHVLLAACDAFDLASEARVSAGVWRTVSYGVFTRALIDKLEEIDRSGNPYLPTYEDLIDSLPDNEFDQFPCAAGDHKNKRLWYTV